MQQSTEKRKVKRTRFKLNPVYEHKRSEGLTRRRNAGTKYQD